MDFPDIQKGQSSLIKNLVYGGIAVFAITGATVLLLKSSDDSNEESGRRSFIKTTGLPEDFFYQEDEKSVTFKENQKKAEQNTIPATEKKRVYKKKQEKKKKTLSAKEAFLIEKQKRIDYALIRKRNKINDARRKTNLTRVATNATTGQQFIESQTDKDWAKYGIEKDLASLPTRLHRTITADRMIACLMKNEIVTDLGGKVTCQVEENIYGAHGRKVLIPAGSNAIGRFTPLKKVGDERVRLFWHRIITPDGININTTQAELTDTMGRSGAQAEIDKRYTERYGLALLFSTISNLAAFQVPVQSVNQQIIVSNYTKDLSSTTNKILDEHINIKPRGRVPAGTRIFINPVRDIWFSKPKENSINVTFSEK